MALSYLRQGNDPRSSVSATGVVVEAGPIQNPVFTLPARGLGEARQHPRPLRQPPEVTSSAAWRMGAGIREILRKCSLLLDSVE